MKRILLSVAVFALTSTVFAQKKIADVAKFAAESIDFGKIKQGVPQKGTFVVTNISNEPLIIEQANPTCGCTIGDWTKSPIAPGATGFISAKFNAASVGHFDKHLSVKFAGVDEIKSITITGDVLSPEDYDKWAAENPVKKIDAVTPVTTTPAKATTKDKKTKTTSTTTESKGS